MEPPNENCSRPLCRPSSTATKSGRASTTPRLRVSRGLSPVNPKINPKLLTLLVLVADQASSLGEARSQELRASLGKFCQASVRDSVNGVKECIFVSGACLTHVFTSNHHSWPAGRRGRWRGHWRFVDRLGYHCGLDWRSSSRRGIHRTLVSIFFASQSSILAL